MKNVSFPKVDSAVNFETQNEIKHKFGFISNDWRFENL